MPTDEQNLARTGPRHAAPRKPLLSRLHMPAGKAIALAAMPSAVLMGMGLTPTLAQAKPVQPPKPFGDAQCATVPDTEADTDTDTNPDAEGAGKPAPDGDSPSPSPSPGGAGSDSGTSRGREPSASSPVKPSPRTKPAPAPAPVTPSPSPSPSKKTNPLDPLGLGEKLTDILTGGGKGSTGPSASPSPSPSPSRSASPAAPGPAQPPPAGDEAKAKAKDGPSPAPKPSGGPAAGTPSPKPSPKPTAGVPATPTPSPDADKALPPCPAGHVLDENEKRAFPNQPWYLEASKLTLTGLTYEGVKRITMVNGQQKSVLKFTADSLAIKDLHQIVNNQGKQSHVTGSGTTSTVSGARITMYTEELKGKLLGVLPATQSPTSLPPLIPGVKLPIPIFFTDVKLRQAGQFGGTLQIPNLHQYLTDGTYP
ncbi:hypothetical protein [Streptomyces sp. NPDC046261]|uniref:hypothetical protein n=1 Tax=Streptomyces sp. NPDC046261 TaxID=3157200 RepID=UPI0033F5B4E5